MFFNFKKNRLSATSGHTFHNKATTIGDGEILKTAKYPNCEVVNIEIFGTGTSTVVFEGKPQYSTTFYPLAAISLSDYSKASEVTTKGVLYQLPLEGMTEIKVRIKSMTDGEITVQGVVMTP